MFPLFIAKKLPYCRYSDRFSNIFHQHQRYLRNYQTPVLIVLIFALLEIHHNTNTQCPQLDLLAAETWRAASSED